MEEDKKINYRVLLQKYMTHIDWEDGSTFVRVLNGAHNPIVFSETEVDTLKTMSNELTRGKA